MKAFLIFLTFFFFVCITIAQETTIHGSILNKNGIPLADVTIVTPSQQYAISDKNGSYILRITDKSTKISLSISRLGCQPIDTIISLNTDFIKVDIVLQEIAYQLDLVTINSTHFNIIEESNRIISDFAILNSKFIFLYKDNKDQKLGLFNINGDLIHEIIIPSYNKFKQIIISCTGTVLVIGKQECKEYYLKEQQFNFLSSFSRKQFEGILQPCIAKIDSSYYFKTYSKHNKVIDFFINSSGQQSDTIISITDYHALEYTQEYFNDILIAYTNFVRKNTPYPIERKNHYDYMIHDDFSEPHIVNENLWDGNMLKLMVDDITDRMVQQYLQLETTPIRAENFFVDQFLYIINYTSKNLLQYDIKSKKLNQLRLKGISWKTKYTSAIDQQTQQVYLVNSKLNGSTSFYLLHLEETNNHLNEITVLNLNRNQTDRLEVFNNTVYYITPGRRFKSQSLLR